MNANALQVIDAFASLRVLLVGDALLDSYLDGASRGICREAPVPVVNVASRTDAPGGAANVAVNLRALGARVSFLSVLGHDAEGERLSRALEAGGVETDLLIRAPGRRTAAKHRVAADGQLLVRFDQGDAGPIAPSEEQALMERLETLYGEADAVLVSDYGLGLITPALRRRLARLQGRTPRLLVVDAKELTPYRELNVTAVKPNYTEAAQLLGIPFESGAARAEQILLRGEQLLALSGAQLAAVTLDRDGAVILERGNPAYRTYGRPVPQSLAAGAGDTFVAALALALAAGAPTAVAGELAAAAARLVVAKTGTAVCSLLELKANLSADEKTLTDADRLAARIAFYRQQGRRIVFTNGCFDLLHRGHVTYLSRAKALGDVLIVGVNSDDSARRLKGPNRPINALEDRVQVLAGLSCIDHIVPFEGDTAHALIERIRPDVFVKGGDYADLPPPEAALVEALGGVVRILGYLEERSTSGIIERIREAAGESRPGAGGDAGTDADSGGAHGARRMDSGDESAVR